MEKNTFICDSVQNSWEYFSINRLFDNLLIDNVWSRANIHVLSLSQMISSLFILKVLTIRCFSPTALIYTIYTIHGLFNTNNKICYYQIGYQ